MWLAQGEHSNALIIVLNQASFSLQTLSVGLLLFWLHTYMTILNKILTWSHFSFLYEVSHFITNYFFISSLVFNSVHFPSEILNSQQLLSYSASFWYFSLTILKWFVFLRYSFIFCQCEIDLKYWVIENIINLKM